MKRAVPIAVIVLGLSAVAAAKEAPPPPGPPRPFSLPKIQAFALPNGMKVTLVPFGDIPRAQVSLVVRAGNADAGDRTYAAPDLFAKLVKEGTETKDAQALARTVAGMGGALETGADEVTTTVGTPVLAEKTAEMVRLLAEVARRPALPASELARLQDDLARDIVVLRGRPSVLAAEAFRALVFPNQPYGHRLPTPAEIKAITVEDVRAFWKGQAGAARAHLYVVGEFDAAAVEAATRDAFGDWNAGPAPSVPPVKPASVRTIHLLDRPGAVQSSVRLGLPVIEPTHRDYIPLAVANSLLGGAFSSRIVSNIRESKGYTYSPRSSIAPYLGTAVWAQVADVKTDVTGAALKEIYKEINGLARKPPPPAELAGTQRYLAGLFAIQMADPNGILGQLQYIDQYGLPTDYLEKYVERVLAVKPADVQRLVRTYLAPARMALVVVGDKATVKKQLAPFGVVVEEPAR